MIPIWHYLKFAGDLKPDRGETEARHKYIDTFKNGELLEVIIRRPSSQRSVLQNNYYWGVVIKLLSEYTGFTKDEMHEVLRQKFWGTKELDLDGELIIIPKSTTEFSTRIFEERLEDIRIWAKIDLDVDIPLPNKVEI